MATSTEMHHWSSASPAVHAQATQSIDVLMLLGFLLAVFTLVAMIYRREMALPALVLPICFAAAAIYGFASGDGVLGAILAGVSVSELRGLRRHQPVVRKPRAQPLYQCESRIDRMFGPTEV